MSTLRMLSVATLYITGTVTGKRSRAEQCCASAIEGCLQDSQCQKGLLCLWTYNKKKKDETFANQVVTKGRCQWASNSENVFRCHCYKTGIALGDSCYADSECQEENCTDPSARNWGARDYPKELPATAGTCWKRRGSIPLKGQCNHHTECPPHAECARSADKAIKSWTEWAKHKVCVVPFDTDLGEPCSDHRYCKSKKCSAWYIGRPELYGRKFSLTTGICEQGTKKTGSKCKINDVCASNQCSEQGKCT